MQTRIPTQKRSIEKRNRIIEKGFELMCENGYYNTNTNDIAKYAGVSTGIIYQYFNDKKEIFIEGVKNYANTIMFPMIENLDNYKNESQKIEDIITDIIEQFIDNHTISKKAHAELVAMSHLDDDIGKIFSDSEFEMTKSLVSIMQNNNIFLHNATEKIHIICGLIDSLSHEIVYHQHDDINYTIMKKEVINIIITILT